MTRIFSKGPRAFGAAGGTYTGSRIAEGTNTVGSEISEELAATGMGIARTVGGAGSSATGGATDIFFPQFTQKPYCSSLGVLQ